MLRKLFGLGRRRAASLADWNPDIPLDEADRPALLAELLQPTHPGLRALCDLVAALPRDREPGPEEKARLERMAGEAALGQRRELLFVEALERMPLALALVEARTPGLMHLMNPLSRSFFATAALWTGPAAKRPFETFSAGQVAAALRVFAKLFNPALSYPHGREEVIVALCRAAVRERSEEALAAIADLLDQIGRARGWARDLGYKLALDILAIPGLTIAPVAWLAEVDREFERRLEVRAAIGREAGPVLAPALDLIFDSPGRIAAATTIGQVADEPATAALAAGGPRTTGETLLALIRIADSRKRFGVEDWAVLSRAGGRFSLCGRGNIDYGFEHLAALLVRRKVDLSDAETAMLVEAVPRHDGLHSRHMLNLALKQAQDRPGGATSNALRKLAGIAGALPPDWRAEVARLGDAGGGGGEEPLQPLPDMAELDDWWGPDKLAARFSELFDPALQDERHLGFLRALEGPEIENEPRARPYMARVRKAAAGILESLAPVAPFVAARPDMSRALARHFLAIRTKTVPPRKWLEEGERILAPVPLEERLALLGRLAAAPPSAAELQHNLRGLIYLSHRWDPAATTPLLADFALRHCFQTDPGVGIRAEKLGNACLWALAGMADGAGTPYLARLLARIKYPKVRAKIDAALEEAARAAGISRGALDELSVPTHDLGSDGTARIPLGDAGWAEIALAGNRAVETRWIAAEGKRLKAPSAAMKAAAEPLKQAKQAAKEVEADLATQIVRLQRLFLEDREWSAADWRARYAEHPLIGAMVSRLIWWVEKDGARQAALPSAGALTDALGRPVDPDGARLRLWHPVEDDVESVLAWRDRLEELEIVQPFAQAWREVYRLTEAERATGTYSNRWAGHILKQHQAMTLARLNGWTVTHRMWVDAPNDAPWHRILPAWGLVADYWVWGAGDEGSPEVLDSQAYVYVSTDRLTFHRYRAEGAGDSAYGPERLEAAPLEEVPPIVFSEIMRHCDLFTAVASIASDPDWRDRGAGAAHPNQWRRDAEAYWTRTSFAPLAVSGTVRRELLERILPRLAIGDRCSFDEQALVVKGKRHTYRIHLGSAAVQIAETRQHVCIVPKAAESAANRVWLPFEGDSTLSLVLSKALLLAADDRITDPVILAQI